MVAPSDSITTDADLYRREAMGAFAHEIRTPLTSIRMVIELAKRLGAGGDAVLDPELATMLNTSVDDLQHLADDLQEISRLERGKIILSTGPCDLAAAVDAARDLLGGGIQLAGPTPKPILGPWDAGRLVRAIAGFAQAANRIGNGSGEVAFAAASGPELMKLTFTSGTPSGAGRPVAADAGFSFFRSRQFILAMGGLVECNRSDRFAEICVGLPLPRGYTP